MTLQVLKMSKEDAQDIIWEGNEDWIQVEEKIIGTSRWSIRYRGIFKHIPTNKYYRICWSKGATEMQDERPFDYNEPQFVEVVEKEKVIKVWVDKE